MRIDPAIEVLRSDRAPQRRAQAAMQAAVDAWRSEPEAVAVLADFARFGEGAPLEACSALEAVFDRPDRAEALMVSLSRHLCGAMAGHPLGHPPFRSGFDGRASTVRLGVSGRAQLVLQAREPGLLASGYAMFSDVLRYDAVLAGRAEAVILRIHGPREQVTFSEEPIRLEPGVRLAFDCTSETLLAECVESRLVTLRLLQGAAQPGPGREYCRESGKLLHQSAGTLVASRREMMASLLGRMGRTDAAPVLAQMALRESDPSLRWQALRECLALDAVAGFGALSTIARMSDDQLTHPAGALRAQLLEAHPQLAGLETC